MMSVGLKPVSKDVDVAMPARMLLTEIGRQRCLI
jgi:hypothetical protein